MKARSWIVVAGLLAVTAVVLGINIRYLYSTPVANTWVWWIGDETWLMAQCNQFVHTGHYINPLAPGSAFSKCSGLLFGSSYLTAALYGLPSLFMKGDTIAMGRTISFLCSIATLVGLWIIAKRYRVGSVLCAFGCLILASTVCFFMASHSARSDMLIGFTVLMLTGSLPLLVKDGNVNRSKLLLFLGLLIPLTLLVNGHVLILSAPMLLFVIWDAGGFKSMRAAFQWVGAAVGGFVALLFSQWALLGSLSLFGPFSGSSGMMPILHLIHLKTDLANVQSRLSIASAWSPAIVWVFCILVAALIVARITYKVRLSQLEPTARRMIACAAIVALSSIFLEFYWERYLIYVLPTVVLSFLILFDYLIRRLPRTFVSGIAAALTISLVFALYAYESETSRLGTVGKTITAANKTAVTDALLAIHSRHAGSVRVFSTVPGECVAMDDSCELITPVMYVQPIDSMMTRKDVWVNAKINYAIVCAAAHRDVDWDDIDTHMYPPDSSKWKVIFERVGSFSDIGRPYTLADLAKLDTLRVYEFQ